MRRFRRPSRSEIWGEDARASLPLPAFEADAGLEIEERADPPRRAWSGGEAQPPGGPAPEELDRAEPSPPWERHAVPEELDRADAESPPDLAGEPELERGRSAFRGRSRRRRSLRGRRAARREGRRGAGAARRAELGARGGRAGRTLRQRARRALVWLGAGAAGFALGLAAAEPLVARLRPELLAVDRVALVGAKRVAGREVAAALGIAAGRPVLAVDAPELRRRVETIPRVARARVALLRPGRILVAIEEREPVAVAVLGTPPTRFWLDAEGVPFLPVGTADASGKTLVVGPADAAPGRADPRLAEGVALAGAVGRAGVRGVRAVHVAGADPAALPALRLESGARVTLGPGPLEPKLERLAALLRARPAEVAAAREIDLRFGDRMVLRSGAPSAAEGGVAGAGGRPLAPMAGSPG